MYFVMRRMVWVFVVFRLFIFVNCFWWGQQPFMLFWSLLKVSGALRFSHSFSVDVVQVFLVDVLVVRLCCFQPEVLGNSLQADLHL